MKKLKKKIKLLEEALLAAKNHLEYCGYGDGWESELAREYKLQDKIDKALNYKLND